MKYERYLYYFVVGRFQHFYDICLVRAFEATGNKIISNWPLYGVVLFSWVIALAEYSCQVPANRLGFSGNGGPFSLMQLKIIQEVITLIIFTVFLPYYLKGSHCIGIMWQLLSA